jgi:hypothetical protein
MGFSSADYSSGTVRRDSVSCLISYGFAGLLASMHYGNFRIVL